MNAMLSRWRARYLKLSARERGFALVAALILVAGIGELAFVDPALKRRAQALHQIASQQAERDGLLQRLAGLQQDPNGNMRTQVATLKTQLLATDREFNALQHGLVQPQHMGALLQSLLTEHRSLQLLGLRTLPVTGLADTWSASSAPSASGRKSATTNDRALAVGSAASGTGGTVDDAWLYRHAVEIRVQGSYADMMAYLQELEGLPRRVHWGDLEIDARRYPSNVMTVTIFTVSLEKSWWVL